MTLIQFLNALMLVLVGASIGVVVWGIRTVLIYRKFNKRMSVDDLELIGINLAISRAILFRTVILGMALGILVAAFIS